MSLRIFARRRAMWTPRVRTPISARSSTPLFRSRISWAMRVRVRAMRSASMTTADLLSGMFNLFAVSQDRVKELTKYTSLSMLVDVEARVISNTRLSADYNVLALAAPEIAAAALPGQFVMVKSSRGGDPLLRRPFSVFEVLRSKNQVDGLTLLSKRIGVTTNILFDAVEGDVISCLGPL